MIYYRNDTQSVIKLRMKKNTIYRTSFNLFRQFIRKSKYSTVTSSAKYKTPWSYILHVDANEKFLI